MSLKLQAPTFLYPHARDYGFDEVCEQIVRALEKRHFDVPGIKVKFDTYGSGKQWMRQVRRITGQEFSLYFCRSQGLLPENVYNDTAAVNNVAISGEKISVYGDHSGPRYHVYVGDDWERDRDWFFGTSGFVNSKLLREPRRYLCYQGADEINCRVRYGRSDKEGYRDPATYLLHDNDIGREYDLQDDPDTPDEPYYTTSEVIDRMTSQLEGELEKIEQTPEKEVAYQFKEEADLPVEGCPEFWTYAENRTAERIKEGRRDPSEIKLAHRYALSQGYRLIRFGVSADGLGIDPDMLHGGYIWLSLDPKQVPRESQSISFGNHLVRIKPLRANDIYVIDEAAYDLRRAQLLADPSGVGRKRFTNEEVGEMFRARAKTMVPWNEYQGDFQKPVIIIGRQLGFDEVEVVPDSEK